MSATISQCGLYRYTLERSWPLAAGRRQASAVGHAESEHGRCPDCQAERSNAMRAYESHSRYAETWDDRIGASPADAEVKRG